MRLSWTHVIKDSGMYLKHSYLYPLRLTEMYINKLSWTELKDQLYKFGEADP